jgi:hypothetical protein
MARLRLQDCPHSPRRGQENEAGDRQQDAEVCLHGSLLCLCTKQFSTLSLRYDRMRIYEHLHTSHLIDDVTLTKTVYIVTILSLRTYVLHSYVPHFQLFLCERRYCTLNLALKG